MAVQAQYPSNVLLLNRLVFGFGSLHLCPFWHFLLSLLCFLFNGSVVVVMFTEACKTGRLIALYNRNPVGSWTNPICCLTMEVSFFYLNLLFVLFYLKWEEMN